MKIIRLIIGIIFTLFAVAAYGQNSKADKILGIYRAVKDGNVSKVQISKNANNTYRAQVIWVENMKDEKGNPKTDHKNPDPALRSTPADKIVLINSVSYTEDGVWSNGKIYDPTRGKSFKVSISFKDDKTLKVKGSLGPFSQTVTWDRLE